MIAIATPPKKAKKGMKAKKAGKAGYTDEEVNNKFLAMLPLITQI